MEDSSNPILDTDHLAMVCGDDLDFQREITAEFLAQLDREVDAIAAAVASRDADALHQNAHALKGSSSTLGARALAGACARLESLGRSTDLSGAEPALEQVRGEALRLRAALDGFLRDRAA